MIVEIRLPAGYSLYKNEVIFSNFDNEIKYEVADFIKNKNLAAEFTAWDYHGIVWWNDELGYWCIEVWRHNIYRVTHLSETLEELIGEIQETYGYE